MESALFNLYRPGFFCSNVYAYFKTHVISLLPRLSLHMYTVLERQHPHKYIDGEKKVILKLCDIIIYSKWPQNIRSTSLLSIITCNNKIVTDE